MKRLLPGLALSLVILIVQPASAITHLVRPDGTGDFPTIQAAVNAAANGDTIELADGTFTGDGNRDMTYAGKTLTIRSQSGDPDLCIIDCQGSAEEPHQVFYLNLAVGPGALLSDVTITGGHHDRGGGIACRGSSPTIVNCVFTGNTAVSGGAIHLEDQCNSPIIGCTFIGNTATNVGGGIYLNESTPSIEDCRFYQNTAWNGGGVGGFFVFSTTLIRCMFALNTAGYGGGGFYGPRYAWPTLDSCTFLANSAGTSGGAAYIADGTATFIGCTLAYNWGPTGAGMYLELMSPTIERTLISHGQIGSAIYCYGSTVPILTCCDLYANDGGDWIDPIADQYEVDGNFSEDPLYCWAEHGNLWLMADSPCLPGNHPDGYDCGGVIGAWPEGCPASGLAVRPDPRPGLRLTSGSSNPFSGTTRITCVIPSRPMGSPTRLCVYDPAGRLIRTLIDAQLPAGSHTITWDGRNSGGQRVAGGVYFYRLSHGGETLTERAILIR